MYLEHFGFRREPFKITPDPDLFFAGASRGAVLEALRFAVGRGEGIVKVVGEVGSGKTMLCRMLERELPDACEVVYLANPRLSPDEVLDAVMFELGLGAAEPGGAGKVGTVRRLTEKLLEMHAHGRQVVIFIEEAQAMPLDTLEEIRLLSNLETSRDKLLQVVLFGQPELDQRLAAHEARQLRERITFSFELAPLGRAELQAYLHQRILASGCADADLFCSGARRRLARHSRGLLRRINILADKALIAAYADGARTVKARHVDRAARDATPARSARARWPLHWELALGALTGVVFAAAFLWLTRDLPAPAASADAAAAVQGGSTVLPALAMGNDAVRPGPD